jgi:hypothetical protein
MPLPENALKELLSRGFLRLVASHAGFIVGTDELDFGTDLSLSHVHAYDEGNERIRYARSGFTLEVQLKATCERQVERTTDALKYDLRATNYNDIVRRQSGNIPLVLVLFVLPDDRDTWLALADSELTLRRCGYFWRPSSDDTLVSNSSTKQITIPLSNRLDISTFESLRVEYTR